MSSLFDSVATMSLSNSTGLIKSNLGEWSEFLGILDSCLYGISDHCILSCGCILSEKKVLSHQDNSMVCPDCGASCYYIGPLECLRNITKLLEAKRQSLGLTVLSGNLGDSETATSFKIRSDSTTTTTTCDSRDSSENLSHISSVTTNLDITLMHSLDDEGTSRKLSTTSNEQLGLLSMLKSAAESLSKDAISSSEASLTVKNSVSGGVAGENSSTKVSFPLSSSNSIELSREVENWISGVDSKSPGTQISSAEAEIREFNFYKCFPIYRKKFLHNTQMRGLLQRSNKNPIVATAISPDCTMFILVGKFKWLIYSIMPDFNDVPTLMYTIDPLDISPPKDGHSWENPMVAMTNSFICVASASGLLRVYEVNNTGIEIVHDQQSDFGIHCMAISPLGNMIAYAIIGRDKNHKESQPMIVLKNLGFAGISSPVGSRSMSFNSTTSVSSSRSTVSRFESSKTITVTSPYRDPISTLSFSQDECYLTCSTYAESRFLVISVINPLEPRMVLKSSRRVDPDENYEGITSVKLFPNDSRYMVVTSAAAASPPIVLDTKISQSSSALSDHSTLTRPSLLMRVDKVGTQIHSCEISPRGDSVAFLDKNGLIYIMHSPGMTLDTRRITIVTEVNESLSYKQAASMRFSPSGQVLFAVDKRGNLHIEDFAAGLPHHAGMGKCRILA